MSDVLDGLEVFPERMRENLQVGGGLAFSQNVLLALVDAGMSRAEGFALVQAAAATAWDEGASFEDLVAADPRVREMIGDRVNELFDPSLALRNLDVVFDRLEKVEVREA
jgi:adenylosuccinate lyase